MIISLDVESSELRVEYLLWLTIILIKHPYGDRPKTNLEYNKTEAMTMNLWSKA